MKDNFKQLSERLGAERVKMPVRELSRAPTSRSAVTHPNANKMFVAPKTGRASHLERRCRLWLWGQLFPVDLQVPREPPQLGLSCFPLLAGKITGGSGAG
jgi:hypothetical protein